MKMLRNLELVWLAQLLLLLLPTSSGESLLSDVDPLPPTERDANATNVTTTAVESTAPPVENACYVCGENGEVGKPSKLITSSLGYYTCSGLAGAGLSGKFSEAQCAIAQEAVEDRCGCLVEGQDPSESPLDDDVFVCSLCPGDEVVTNPEGLVFLPDAAVNRTCGEYLLAANEGIIEEDQCATLQNYTNATCGCADPIDTDYISRPNLADNETYVCPVCGEGMISSIPDGLVAVPSQPERTCLEVELAALEGKILQQQCNLIKGFVTESCRCEQGSLEDIEFQARPEDAYNCSVCGEDNVVTLPDAIVSIPTQPDRTCAELLNANTIGNINEVQCLLLQPFVGRYCGCTPRDETLDPTGTPTEAPTEEPTQILVPTSSPAPTGWEPQGEDCYDNLIDVYVNEREVEDASIRRRYVLCPGTTFDLGHMDDQGHIVKGDAFLMLRPNVLYQCGADGKKENSCILKGGDFGVVSFYGVYDGIYETVDNVRIKGLTFQSQSLISAALEAAGDIQFIDCEFKENENLVPVLMQWRGEGPEVPSEEARRRKLRSVSDRSPYQQFKERIQSRDVTHVSHQEGSRRLQVADEDLGPEYNQVVSFKGCVFRNNFVSERMGFPGIIENSYESELNVIESVFMENIYGQQNNPAPFGYAIRSFGPLRVESSCFVDNVFYGKGPINVLGAPHTATQNYVRSFQEDIICEFLAVLSSRDDTTMEMPICFNSDLSTCPVTLPAASSTPVKPPTASPVAATTTSSSSDPTAAACRTALALMVGIATLVAWQL